MSTKGQDSVWPLQRDRVYSDGPAGENLVDPLQGEFKAADTADESVREFVRRDYYTSAGEQFSHASGFTHCPNHDARVPGYELLKSMMDELDVSDGDEVQLLMVKTGRRPFGDRRFIMHSSRERLTLARQETDDEVLARIKSYES